MEAIATYMTVGGAWPRYELKDSTKSDDREFNKDHYEAMVNSIFKRIVENTGDKEIKDYVIGLNIHFINDGYRQGVDPSMMEKVEAIYSMTCGKDEVPRTFLEAHDVRTFKAECERKAAIASKDRPAAGCGSA